MYFKMISNNIILRTNYVTHLLVEKDSSQCSTLFVLRGPMQTTLDCKQNPTSTNHYVNHMMSEFHQLKCLELSLHMYVLNKTLLNPHKESA